MSEHMFFQGNPSGKAKDAPSELSTLSVLCELLGKVDALEQRISDVNDANLYGIAQLEERIDELEQRVDGNAEQIRKDWNAEFKHYGYLEERLTKVEERIEVLERKLNHKGGNE